MKNILYINHKLETHCGVYQQGIRHYEVIAKSNKYKINYAECSSEIEVIEQINKYKSDAILLNYDAYTLSWSINMKSITIPQIAMMHHPLEYDKYIFDYQFVLDTTKEVDNIKWFKCHRPLLHFMFEEYKNIKPTFGTLCFLNRFRNIDYLIRSIQNEFDEAIINLHTPSCWNLPSDYEYIMYLQKQITKPHIELNISQEWLATDQIINKLNKNDANILLYKTMPDCGISSALDFLLMAQKPMILSNSHQFRHIINKYPTYPSRSIKELLNMGDLLVKRIYNENRRLCLLDHEFMFDTIFKNQ